MGEGVVWLEADGFLILIDCPVNLAFVEEGDAEVEVGVGVIRFEADDFLRNWPIASSICPLLKKAMPRS